MNLFKELRELYAAAVKYGLVMIGITLVFAGTIRWLDLAFSYKYDLLLTQVWLPILGGMALYTAPRIHYAMVHGWRYAYNNRFGDAVH